MIIKWLLFNNNELNLCELRHQNLIIKSKVRLEGVYSLSGSNKPSPLLAHALFRIHGPQGLKCKVVAWVFT